MIKFLMVHGHVLIDDKQRSYSQMAIPTLEIDSADCLIATAEGASAWVVVNGKSIHLGPSSFLRLRGNRSWWDRHQESLGRDTRLFVGRLWARIAKDQREIDAGDNATVGVRG